MGQKRHEVNRLGGMAVPADHPIFGMTKAIGAQSAVARMAHIQTIP
jgi:hypothetical protein